MIVSLNTKEAMRKLEVLAGLNRTGELVRDSGGLPILLDLLQDGSVDRQMVASVIMTSGDEGQWILSKFLKEHPNEKVWIAIASCFAYWTPEKQKDIWIVIEED